MSSDLRYMAKTTYVILSEIMPSFQIIFPSSYVHKYIAIIYVRMYRGREPVPVA